MLERLITCGTVDELEALAFDINMGANGCSIESFKMEIISSGMTALKSCRLSKRDLRVARIDRSIFNRILKISNDMPLSVNISYKLSLLSSVCVYRAEILDILSSIEV